MRHLVLFWLLTVSHVAIGQSLSEQQAEELGRAAAFYVGGAYAIELATTGDCKGIVKMPIDHQQSINVLLANSPAPLRAQFEQLFSAGVPPDVRRSIQEIRNTLLGAATQLHGKREFLCGSIFGMGATQKIRGAQEWRKVTGKLLPIVD